MKPKRLDHVAIAVRSLDDALPAWRDGLGIECTGVESVEGEGVRVAFLPVGETRLELMEPSRGDSPVQRFLDSRGEGLHHLCFEVDDLGMALDELRQRGFRVLDERPGAGGARVAFVHPKSANGVLIELRQAGGTERP